MTTSSYHQQFQAQSNQELQNKADAKEKELADIFSQVQLCTDSDPVRVAILGCGDKRLIEHHKNIFSKILHRDIELTTFDISIQHLYGEERVFQHDCTLPIPLGPFDITYAHVLMKFIETEKQWVLMKNSYYALVSGGIAIHIFDQEEVDSRTTRLLDGMYSVSLDDLENKLKKENIEYIKLQLQYGPAIILKKE